VFTKLAIIAALCLGVAYADVVTATNAGPLISSSEDLSGHYLNGIVGALTTSSDSSKYPDFESVFRITIQDYQAFSAETVPVGAHGIADTDLFLFDSSGNGVYMNDDISGSNTLSCLPSAGAGTPCPTPRNGAGPTADGIYYLAIAIGANYPVDSSSNELFNPTLLTDVVGPTGGVGAFAGWDDNAFSNPNFDQIYYDIVLTGTTPEPATYLLIAAPLAALLVWRRRQRPQ
jgi:hypothetical protein